MATPRVTKSVVARCPWCPWSKLIFGPTKWELQLQAACMTVEHTASFKIPTHNAPVDQQQTLQHRGGDAEMTCRTQ
jgi:hypothetical protein